MRTIYNLLAILSTVIAQNGIIFEEDFADLSPWTIQRQSGTYIHIPSTQPSFCTDCIALRAGPSSYYDSITTTIDTTSYSGPFYIDIDFYMYSVSGPWGAAKNFQIQTACEGAPTLTQIAGWQGDSDILRQDYLNTVIEINPACTGSSYITIKLYVYTSNAYEYTYVENLRLCSGYDVAYCGTFTPTFSPTAPTTLSPTQITNAPTSAPSIAPTTPIFGSVWSDNFINLDQWTISRQSGTYISTANLPTWCSDCVRMAAGPSSWYDSIYTGFIDTSAYKGPFYISVNYTVSAAVTYYFKVGIRCDAINSYTDMASFKYEGVTLLAENKLVAVDELCNSTPWMVIRLLVYVGSTSDYTYVDYVKLCAGYGHENGCGTFIPTNTPTESPNIVTLLPSKNPSIISVNPSKRPTMFPSITTSNPSELPTNAPVIIVSDINGAFNVQYWLVSMIIHVFSILIIVWE